MKSVYLLTGKPGTGKTSLIKQAVSDFALNALRSWLRDVKTRVNQLPQIR